MFSCAKIVDYVKKTMLKSPRSLSISYKYLNILNCCTLFAAFMSALFVSRSATVSVCPFWEATYARVQPSCKQLKIVVNQLYIFEYFKLLYLCRRIYVRFIRQQERQSLSVSILGSYIRWGSTNLHTKLT